MYVRMYIHMYVCALGMLQADLGMLFNRQGPGSRKESSARFMPAS